MPNEKGAVYELVKNWMIEMEKEKWSKSDICSTIVLVML